MADRIFAREWGKLEVLQVRWPHWVVGTRVTVVGTRDLSEC